MRRTPGRRQNARTVGLAHEARAPPREMRLANQDRLNLGHGLIVFTSGRDHGRSTSDLISAGH